MSVEDIHSIEYDNVAMAWVKEKAAGVMRGSLAASASKNEVLSCLINEAWLRKERAYLVHPILEWGSKHGLVEFETFKEENFEQAPFSLSDRAVNGVYGISEISGKVSGGNEVRFPIIRSIPEQVFMLPNLASFTLAGNNPGFARARLSGVPETIGQARRLTSLALPFCGLKEIKTKVFTPWLEELNLNMNRIDCIPDAIGRSESLGDLQLESNDLKWISERTGDLKRLEVLCIGGSYNLRLPESITNLRGLKMLICTGVRDLTDDQVNWVRRQEEREQLATYSRIG